MKYSKATMIDQDDFVIRVRPYQNDDGSWNGDIDLAIISQPNNKLSDDDYYQMMYFCKMMASTVPIMDQNPKIREIVSEYVENYVDNRVDVSLEDEYEVDEQDTKPKITSLDGNIISIDFKTKGNA